MQMPTVARFEHRSAFTRHDRIRSTSSRTVARNRNERHHRPMRFISRLCMLVVFSLAIGLACSEIPELLGFADDPSNDFVLSSNGERQHRMSPAAYERSTYPRSNPISKPLFAPVWRLCSLSSPAHLTGAELLLFLSTQRN